MKTRLLLSISLIVVMWLTTSTFGQDESGQDESVQKESSQEDSAFLAVPAALKFFDGTRIRKVKNLQDTEEESPFTIEGELAVEKPFLNLDSSMEEKFPKIEEPQQEEIQKRPVSAKLVTWKSDDFRHRHLLFEEPEFESHGVGRCSESKQFLLSGKRFFGKALFLPVTTMRGKPWQWQCAPGK